MTGPPGSAASMAGCGLCAVLAAVALSGWNPARRLDRAWAARSHGSCSSLHALEHNAKAQKTSRRPARKRCPKLRRHAAGPNPQSHAVGPSGSSGTSGGATTPALPSGTPAPAEAPAPESGSTPPPSLPEVQVSAVEYHYTLSRSSVPAGRVIIEFVDNGQDEHNLNAEGEGGALAATFATEVPKAVTRKTVELHPGSYTLFCSLPEHEAKGMKATLTVE